MSKPKFDLDAWFHTVIVQAVLWAAAVCWLIEAGMNFRYGYTRAGLGLAAAFVAVAVFAAFLPYKFAGIAEAWSTPAGFFKRLFLAPFIVICVGLSQVAGWSNLGTLLADSQVARETAATSRETAAEALAKKRAELAGIALPAGETKAGLAEKLKLEQTRTSGRYPDGNGPAATALKDKIALFDRVEQLEAEIKQATRALESKRQVSGGTPDLDVLAAIFGPSTSATEEDEAVKKEQEATRRDVAFWVPVGIAAVIGLFANFGFALAGVGQDRGPDRKTQSFIERFDLGPKALPGGGAQKLYDELVERFGRDAVEAHLPGLRASDAPAFGASARDAQHVRIPPAPEEVPVYQPKPLGGHPPPFPPSFGGPSDAHFASGPVAPVQHGAPINITFAGGGAPAVGPAPPSAPPPERAVGSVPGTERQVAGASSRGTAEQPRQLPPLLTGPPVDRSTANRRQDHLMTFRQARLEVCPGALVSADDMYACYAAWAGERRMSQAAFNVLLSELADVPQEAVGGHLHFYDFAIRRTQLRAAGA